MNKLMIATAFTMTAMAFGLVGCATDFQADQADQDTSSTSSEELTRAAQKLVGSYEGGGVGIPYFEGVVFKQDGTFLADIDTGIRCFRAPCPSHVRLDGTFQATKSTLTLQPKSGPATGFYGQYKYTLKNGSLKLTQPSLGLNWSASLTKGLSYCAAPVDCEGQDLIVPACVGQFTCASNHCGWDCSLPTNTVAPANATNIVARNAGGGFTPLPPAGSTCAFGASEFTLDLTTNQLDWTTCTFVDWQTAMHPETGSRTLTDEEVATVRAALDEVKISNQDICGADKPWLTLSVTTPAGEKTYKDSFYSCQGAGPFVDNIDAVFGAFHPLAH